MGYIHLVATSADHRRQGHAQRVMAALLDWCEARHRSTRVSASPGTTGAAEQGGAGRAGGRSAAEATPVVVAEFEVASAGAPGAEVGRVGQDVVPGLGGGSGRPAGSRITGKVPLVPPASGSVLSGRSVRACHRKYMFGSRTSGWKRYTSRSSLIEPTRGSGTRVNGATSRSPPVQVSVLLRPM
ncbi:GNAT family N-acetyltransferase [Streptomyces sp. RTd22]|uniref:GNAT family N-acetyltransferase n=1 Tax=Streptomyces sp. RTd22 TaxID=1841249 RepID=UPI000D1AC856